MNLLSLPSVVHRLITYVEQVQTEAIQCFKRINMMFGKFAGLNQFIDNILHVKKMCVNKVANNIFSGSFRFYFEEHNEHSIFLLSQGVCQLGEFIENNCREYHKALI